MNDTILILEDNDERVEAFKRAVATLDAEFDLKIWRDAHSILAECERYFPSAALISLDHDLVPQPGATADPGDGLQVAKWLAACRPACPVLIHSSNTDRAYSMQNELRFADWVVDRVGPLGANWVETTWLSKVRELLSEHGNTWPARHAADHDLCINRAILSLDGLSVGDGFGECFFTSASVFQRRLEMRDPPPSPWIITDDTAMALSIVRCLSRYGFIEQNALAAAFAREYALDPRRGYGGMAHAILRAIGEGVSWHIAAGRAFDGQGSCGNGGAMRAGPIGAYFADDYDRVMFEAKASAEITHAHPDGQTGAVAVGLAAAWMYNNRAAVQQPTHALIEFVLERLPHTDTYYSLKKALKVPFELEPPGAARLLGNGSRVIASDTVPFCLWCAARHASNYTDALWATVSGFGDVDTTCAIVGGIVAMSAGRESIPESWLTAREPLTV